VGVGRAWASGLALFLVLSIAPTTSQGERTRIDWQRGLFIGRGIAVGDLRSPSRELARVKAQRQAKAQARALLLERIGELPWATGKSGTDKQKALASAEALADAVFRLGSDVGTDGSVVIEMALPLDALRSLVFGPDPIVASQAAGPSGIVIDARGLALTPALGFELSDGAERYRGPTLFFTSEAEARAHAAIGSGATVVVAQRSNAKKSAGTILLPSGALKSLLAARPLVAILWKSKK
jgi:hypothetical protein